MTDNPFEEFVPTNLRGPVEDDSNPFSEFIPQQGPTPEPVSEEGPTQPSIFPQMEGDVADVSNFGVDTSGTIRNELPEVSTPPLSVEESVTQNPFLRGGWRGLLRQQQAYYTQLATVGSDAQRVEYAKAIAEIDRKLKSYEPQGDIATAAQEYAKIREGGSVASAFGFLVKNPKFATVLATEALAGSPASLVAPVVGAGAGSVYGGPGGATAGLAAGSLAGSGVDTYVATFAEEMRARGFDPSNPEHIESFVKDKDAMAAVKKTAVIKGMVVGAVDAATSLLLVNEPLSKPIGAWLGKFIAPSNAAGKVATDVGVKTAVGVPIEGAGAGIGEAGGQILSGQDWDPIGVMEEAVLGFPAHVADAGVATAVSVIEERRTNAALAAAERDLDALIKQLSEEAVGKEVSSASTAIAEGRTEFGVFRADNMETSVGLPEDVLSEAARQPAQQQYSLIAVRPEDVTAKFESLNRFMVEEGSIDITGPNEAAIIMAREAILQNNAEMYADAYTLGARVKDPAGTGNRVVLGDLSAHRVLPDLEDVTPQVAVDDAQGRGRLVDFRKFATLTEGKFIPDDFALIEWVGNRLPKNWDASFASELIIEGKSKDLYEGFISRDNTKIVDALRQLRPELEAYFAERSVKDPGVVDEIKAAVDLGYIQFAPDSRWFDAEVLNRAARPITWRNVNVIGKTEEEVYSLLQQSASPLRRAMREADSDIQFHPSQSALARLGPEIYRQINQNLKQTDLKVGWVDYRDETIEKYAGTGYDDTKLLAIEFLQKLVRRTKLSLPMRFRIGQERRQATLTKNLTADGFLFYEIKVDSSYLDSPAGLISVLAHEFGHAIASDKLSRSPLHVRAAVFGAYQRYMTQAEKFDADFILRHGRGQFLGRRGFPSTTSVGYALRFEEWFAEQTVRYMEEQSKPVGILGRFFRRMGKTFRSIYNLWASQNAIREQWEARFGAEFAGTAPEIKLFYDQVMRLKTDATWGDFVKLEIERETRRKNAGASANPNTAVPMQAESARVYAVLDKFLRDEAGTLNLSNGQKDKVANVKAEVDRMNWFMKYGMHLRQVAAMNPKNVELQRAVEFLELAQRDAGRIMVSAEEVLKDWQRLPTKQAAALTDFMFTLQEQDFRSAQEKKAGVVRGPTPEEFDALAQFYKLDEKTLEVYQGIRQQFLDAANRIEVLRVVEAQKILDPQAREQALKEIKTTFDRWRSVPYFPMTRFGTWTVTVKDNSDKVHSFQTFETKKEMIRAFEIMNEDHPAIDGWKVRAETLPEDVRQFSGVPPWLMDKIAEMPGLTQKQKEWMSQMKYELAPTRSFTKRFLRRKKTAGYSQDGMRNFAQYFSQHGRYYARVKYEPLIRGQIDKLRDTSQESGMLQARTRLASFIEYQLNEFLNPGPDWSWARSFAAIWHLGLMPASAAVNLTQTPTVTAPFLATKFGDLKALNSLRKAASTMNAYVRKGNIKAQDGTKFKLLARSYQEDFMDQSMAAELYTVSSQDLRFLGFGKAARHYQTVTEKMMLLFHAAEQFNRRVAFMSAVELALENGNSEYVQSLKKTHEIQYNQLLAEGMSEAEANAFLAGKDTVLQTQYDFTRAARPRFMRGRKGVLFTFYMFTQNTAFTLYNNGWPMAFRYALIMMALAGPMGLLPDDVEEMLNALGRKAFGGDFNLEKATREFIREVLGDNPAVPPDLLLHGLGRYSLGPIPGLGALPYTPSTDLSRSIAFPKILPLDTASLWEPGARYNEAIGNATERGAGAAFSPIFGMMKALSATELDWADLKRWEYAMPRFARQSSKAIRYGLEGGERTRSYNPVIEYDVNNPIEFGELVGLAMGFQPTKQNQYYDMVSQAYESKIVWQAKRSSLLQEIWRQRVWNENSDAVGEVLLEIHKFNQQVRDYDPKLVITSKTITRSLRNRSRKRQQIEQGQDIPESVRQNFPEVRREKVRTPK